MASAIEQLPTTLWWMWVLIWAISQLMLSYWAVEWHPLSPTKTPAATLKLLLLFMTHITSHGKSILLQSARMYVHKTWTENIQARVVTPSSLCSSSIHLYEFLPGPPNLVALRFSRSMPGADEMDRFHQVRCCCKESLSTVLLWSQLQTQTVCCCCDHSSEMESHWHRALFLVVGTVTSLSIRELQLCWKYVVFHVKNSGNTCSHGKIWQLLCSSCNWLMLDW